MPRWIGGENYIQKKRRQNKKSVKKGATLASWRLGSTREIKISLSLFFLIASITKKKREGARNQPAHRETNSRQKQPPLSFMQGKSTSRKKDDTPGLCQWSLLLIFKFRDGVSAHTSPKRLGNARSHFTKRSRARAHTLSSSSHKFRVRLFLIKVTVQFSSNL